MVDLIIRGSLAATLRGMVRQDIAIEGGTIVDVADELSVTAREEIEAEGLVALPGMMDAHVHFNEPGREHWEGFASGSAALAAGGGTAFIDMPLNSHPPLLNGADFDAKLAAAKRSACTDFAFWGGLIPGNLGSLPELAERGVVGFKAFMCDSGIEEFPAADDLTLLEGMRMAAGLHLPVAVHAESEQLTGAYSLRLGQSGADTPEDYLRSRPLVAELEAIQRAILLAGEAGCDLHIVHVSSARAAQLVAEARRRGARVTCETCPHYLNFDAASYLRLGSRLKCSPPLRDDSERQALRQALLAGTIDFVASDHSPCPPELKQTTSPFSDWGGVNGVQSTLNVLLEQGFDVFDIARLTAQRPAARFSFARKGRITPGCDGDLALLDVNGATTLDQRTLLTRHKTSPYLGLRLKGKVRRTLIRGHTVFLDGKIDRDFAGRLLRPQA